MRDEVDAANPYGVVQAKLRREKNLPLRRMKPAFTQAGPGLNG